MPAWPARPDYSGCRACGAFFRYYGRTGWTGGEVRGSVRGDGSAAGEQFPGVFENNNAITKQAPALLRVTDDGSGRLAIRTTGVRTPWRMRAHSRASCWFGVVFLITPYCARSVPCTAWPVVTVFRVVLCRFHVVRFTRRQIDATASSNQMRTASKILAEWLAPCAECICSRITATAGRAGAARAKPRDSRHGWRADSIRATSAPSTWTSGRAGKPVRRWVSRRVSSRSASSVQECTAGVALALRK
jgi:hypothetical protein